MERNEQAEAAYAAAWQQWCMTSDVLAKNELERVMDDLQPQIAASPKDPRWSAFIDTLPGYREFWQGWYEAMKDHLDKMKKDAR
jgi:hypothetical protein